MGARAAVNAEFVVAYMVDPLSFVVLRSVMGTLCGDGRAQNSVITVRACPNADGRVPARILAPGAGLRPHGGGSALRRRPDRT
jgi:hypothetical protein